MKLQTFTFHFQIVLLAIAFACGGCADTTEPKTEARSAMNEAIKNEPPGNYFIGRRYYKVDYKFWGYLRKPGEPWSSAKLVMLNEQKKLAPDRQAGQLGADHGYEYKIYGSFSGETVYEPASNGFYPEFVLTGYEVRTTTPPPIFHTSQANTPSARVIGQPY